MIEINGIEVGFTSEEPVKETFEFTVEHDGAVGSIMRGTTIRAQRCTEITGDGIYVVKVSNCPMVRRVQVLPGWSYRVFCDDPHYPPVEVSASAHRLEFQVLGRYLEIVRGYHLAPGRRS